MPLFTDNSILEEIPEGLASKVLMVLEDIEDGQEITLRIRKNSHIDMQLAFHTTNPKNTRLYDELELDAQLRYVAETEKYEWELMSFQPMRKMYDT